MSLWDSLLKRFKKNRESEISVPTEETSAEEVPALTMRDLPEKSLDSVPEARWPPFPRAVEAVTSRAIIDSQAELIRSLCRVTPLSEKEIDAVLLPCIVSLAEFVHLLPASQYDHHMGTGGLFGHSLEVAYYAVNGAKSRIFDVTESPEKAHLNRSRWILAAALCGLVHDIGKAVTDIIVTSESDQEVWYPRQETLAHWLRRKKLASYYVSWKQNRENNRHQTASVEYAHAIIPQATYSFLSAAGNIRIEQEIRDAVLNSAASKGHPLCELLSMADVYSCKVDKERRKGIDPKSFYVSSPVAESVVDCLRDLIKDGTWKVNEPGGRVFVTTAGCFVVWTHLDDLINRLVAKDIKAVPREPNVLADILIDHSVAVPPPDELTTTEGRYWSICPICSANGFLTTLRIDDAKRLYASGIPPIPIVAMVRGLELSEDEKASWIAKNGSLPVARKPDEAAEEDAYIAGLMAAADQEVRSEVNRDKDEIYQWLGLMPAEDIPDDEDEEAGEMPEEEVPDYLLDAPPPDLADYAASLRDSAAKSVADTDESASETKTQKNDKIESKKDPNRPPYLEQSVNNDCKSNSDSESNDASIGDAFLSLMPGGMKSKGKNLSSDERIRNRTEPTLGATDAQRNDEPCKSVPASAPDTEAAVNGPEQTGTEALQRGSEASVPASKETRGATDAQFTRNCAEKLSCLENLSELSGKADFSPRNGSSKDVKRIFRDFAASSMPKRNALLAKIRSSRKRVSSAEDASGVNGNTRTVPVLSAGKAESSTGETFQKVQPVELFVADPRQVTVSQGASAEDVGNASERSVGAKKVPSKKTESHQCLGSKSFKGSATDAQHIKPRRLQSEADALKAGYYPGEAYFFPEEVFQKSVAAQPWDPNSPLLPKSDGSPVAQFELSKSKLVNAENTEDSRKSISGADKLSSAVAQGDISEKVLIEGATDAQLQFSCDQDAASDPSYFPDDGFTSDPFSAENPEFEEEIRFGTDDVDVCQSCSSENLPPPPSSADYTGYAGIDDEDRYGEDIASMQLEAAALLSVEVPDGEGIENGWDDTRSRCADASAAPRNTAANVSSFNGKDSETIAEYIPDMPDCTIPVQSAPVTADATAENCAIQGTRSSRKDGRKVQPVELLRSRDMQKQAGGKKKKEKAAKTARFGQQIPPDTDTGSNKLSISFFDALSAAADSSDLAPVSSSSEKGEGSRPKSDFRQVKPSSTVVESGENVTSSVVDTEEDDFGSSLMPDSRFTEPSGKRRGANRGNAGKKSGGLETSVSIETDKSDKPKKKAIVPSDGVLPKTNETLGKKKKRVQKSEKVKAGKQTETAEKPKALSKELRLKAMFEEMKRQMSAGSGPWISEPILPDKLGMRTSADGFVKAAEKEGIPLFLIGTVIVGYQPPPILAWDPKRREFILKNREIPRTE